MTLENEERQGVYLGVKIMTIYNIQRSTANATDIRIKTIYTKQQVNFSSNHYMS
jgi:hypothetical protein